MDIKVRITYYSLLIVTDNKYHVFAREEILGPYLRVTQLEGLGFDTEEDAKRYIEKMSRGENGDTKQVTI